MIVDTSALIAILARESDAERYADTLQRADTSSISAATYVEFTIVADGRKIGERADALLRDAAIRITPFTAEQAHEARLAHQRFGQGRGGLNLGDCFAYALAKVTGEPLLFKGGDFARTDITAA